MKTLIKKFQEPDEPLAPGQYAVTNYKDDPAYNNYNPDDTYSVSLTHDDKNKVPVETVLKELTVTPTISPYFLRDRSFLNLNTKSPFQFNIGGSNGSLSFTRPGVKYNSGDNLISLHDARQLGIDAHAGLKLYLNLYGGYSTTKPEVLTREKSASEKFQENARFQKQYSNLLFNQLTQGKISYQQYLNAINTMNKSLTNDLSNSIRSATNAASKPLLGLYALPAAAMLAPAVTALGSAATSAWGGFEAAHPLLAGTTSTLFNGAMTGLGAHATYKDLAEAKNYYDLWQKTGNQYYFDKMMGSGLWGIADGALTGLGAFGTGKSLLKTAQAANDYRKAYQVSRAIDNAVDATRLPVTLSDALLGVGSADAAASNMKPIKLASSTADAGNSTVMASKQSDIDAFDELLGLLGIKNNKPHINPENEEFMLFHEPKTDPIDNSDLILDLSCTSDEDLLATIRKQLNNPDFDPKTTWKSVTGKGVQTRLQNGMADKLMISKADLKDLLSHSVDYDHVTSDFNQEPLVAGIYDPASDTPYVFKDATVADPETGIRTPLTPELQGFVADHELAHLYLWDNNGIIRETPRKLVTTDSKYLEGDDLFASPEMDSRWSELKDYFGILDDTEVTPEMWEYAKRHFVKDTRMDFNMGKFLHMKIHDLPEWCKWGSKAFMATPFIYQGAKAVNQKRNGGKLNKIYI